MTSKNEEQYKIVLIKFRKIIAEYTIVRKSS